MRVALLALALAACKGTDDPEDTDLVDTDTDVEDTDIEVDTGIPDDPRPITIEVTGAITQTLVFDEPSCTWHDGIPQFRAFWRNAGGAHVFVLVAEVLNVYEGPGEYTPATPIVRVKLQEEAGGYGYYFSTEDTDTVLIDVEQQTATQAWGTFSADQLHGDQGAITISPAEIPIWCPSFE